MTNRPTEEAKAVFAKRTAKLPPRPAKATAPPSPPPAAEPEEPPEPDRPAGRPSKKRARSRRDHTIGSRRGGRRQVIVELPEHHHLAVHRDCRDNDSTLAEIVLGVLRHTQQQLIDANSETPPESESPPMEGFLPAGRPAAAAAAKEPTMRTALQFTDAEAEGVARLADACGLSVTALVRAACDLHYGTPGGGA